MNNTEWQPIETAPKDGTCILVFDTAHRITISYNCNFDTNWSVMWDNTRTEINPTHWMPLPKPPQNL